MPSDLQEAVDYANKCSRQPINLNYIAIPKDTWEDIERIAKHQEKLEQPRVMIHFIITVCDKNGRVIHLHERIGYENTVKLVAALIENPTWSITIRQA